MKIDDEFKLRGQRYVCTDHQPYETRDGRWLELLVLESNCPDCGRGFRLLATKTNTRRRDITRRCEDCRQPGVRVEPRRRREPTAAKATTRRKTPPPKLRRRRRIQTASEARPLRNSRSAAVEASPAQSAPASSAALIARQEMIRETYMVALGMLDAPDGQRITPKISTDTLSTPE